MNYTKLTQKEIAKLPKYSRNRIGGVFRLTESIFIDNVAGYGATKEHTQIKEKGFATMLSVEDALVLFNDPVDEEKIVVIKNNIVEGFGVASPRLFLDVEPYMSLSKKKCALAGSEGLNIVHALHQCGASKIPVQVMMLGYAMRHIDDRNDFLNQISYGVLDQNNNVTRCLVNDTTI